MSVIKHERWQCDGCGHDGGQVNERETIPEFWLRMDVLLAVKQTVAEQQRTRLLHLCKDCTHYLLYGHGAPSIKSHLVSEAVEELRVLWRRSGGGD